MSIDNLIYNTAIKNGIPSDTAKIIVAQAKHETANYTSPVFRANNNLFGYKYVGQKLATKGTAAPASEGSLSYARYATLSDSVLELVNWLKRREREKKLKIADLTTPEKYAAALKNAGYYGDSVSNYTKNLKHYLPTVAVVGGFGVVGVLLFFYLLTYK